MVATPVLRVRWTPAAPGSPLAPARPAGQNAARHGGPDMYAWVIARSLVVGSPALKEEKREPDKPPEGNWEMERFEYKGKSYRVAIVAWLEETVFGYTDGALNYEKYKPTFFRVGQERRADL